MLRRWIFCTGTVSCSPEIMATCSFIYNRVCLYSVQCSATVWWHTLYNTLKLYLTRYSNSQLSISFHFECKILVAACVLIRLLVTVAIKCFQLGGCHCYQLTTVIALPQRGIVRKIDKSVWKCERVLHVSFKKLVPTKMRQLWRRLWIFKGKSETRWEIILSTKRYRIGIGFWMYYSA